LNPTKSFLSDINPRLIDCYASVRDECDEVVELLTKLRKKHSAEHYYSCRERLNSGTVVRRVERAALQVYLNKTCFNGLYRENRRGHFNVPIGRYKNPSIFDAINLRAVSEVLSHAEITCQPFDSVLETAKAGDFVYLDPPYHPLNATSNFTSYTRHGFDESDQTRLRDFCIALDRKGVRFMQSNSSAGLIQDLYRGFNVRRVSARRSINSKARRRGPVDELVIRNFT